MKSSTRISARVRAPCGDDCRTFHMAATFGQTGSVWGVCTGRLRGPRTGNRFTNAGGLMCAGSTIMLSGSGGEARGAIKAQTFSSAERAFGRRHGATNQSKSISGDAGPERLLRPKQVQIVSDESWN